MAFYFRRGHCGRRWPLNIEREWNEYGTGSLSDDSKRARNFTRLFDNFEVDSNPAERALRAVALGRKNYYLRMEIDPQQQGRVNGPRRCETGRTLRGVIG